MRTGLATLAAVSLAAMLAVPAGWSQNTRQAVNAAPQPAPRNIEMVPARARLVHTLNAKKIKSGDPVTAKLDQTVNLPNEPSLKRNTVLVGHVDSVVASQHHSTSKVVVTFNQAKLKNGSELPVKVTVMAVAGPQLPQSGEEAGAMPAGAAPPAAGPGPAGGAPGAPGAPPAMPAPPPEQPSASPGVPPAGSLNSVRQGIPGVMLQSSIHNPASATFISKDRNVDVPGGTEMRLAIAVIPKGVRVQ